MSHKVDLCTIAIDNITFEDSIKRIDNLIKQKKKAFVLTPNVDHIINLQTDPDFQTIYDNADLILADGMPLIWASKFLGSPLKQRIAGSDLMPALCHTAAQKGYKVFLLGGRPNAAIKAKAILETNNPGLNICGTYCPPFGFENDNIENQKIIEEVSKCKPDLLFVGLGSPKQEKWIYNNLNAINVPVSIGIGVTIEFISGDVVRAPVWMQTSGLEWVWRLAMEPRRLWKRYLLKDMKFFKIIVREKIKKSTCR